MSFILVHQATGLCGHEPSLINPEQIASVMPVANASNNWAVQRSNACLRLNDGSRINVKETVQAIMGVLQEAAKLKDGAHTVFNTAQMA